MRKALGCVLLTALLQGCTTFVEVSPAMALRVLRPEDHVRALTHSGQRLDFVVTRLQPPDTIVFAGGRSAIRTGEIARLAREEPTALTCIARFTAEGCLLVMELGVRIALVVAQAAAR